MALLRDPRITHIFAETAAFLEAFAAPPSPKSLSCQSQSGLLASVAYISPRGLLSWGRAHETGKCEGTADECIVIWKIDA